MDMKGSFHRAFFRSWSSFVALLGCPSSQIAPKGALGTFRKRSSKFILDWPPNLPDIIYYRNLSYIIIYYRYLTNTPIINMLSWYVMISYISIYIYLQYIHMMNDIFVFKSLPCTNCGWTGHQRVTRWPANSWQHWWKESPKPQPRRSAVGLLAFHMGRSINL